ncbi:hypothetical protein DPMN_169554 [Dreissena polymorpha]|uniref:Uncharacterized protein n=1 Tax=Dreissena polymorpha TaxID=45954 RepID=A0A9D4DUL7_DREPO|nr:hypothetical protein DPMN_169554 [Dreissena polymorpha]
MKIARPGGSNAVMWTTTGNSLSEDVCTRRAKRKVRPGISTPNKTSLLRRQAVKTGDSEHQTPYASALRRYNNRVSNFPKTSSAVRTVTVVIPKEHRTITGHIKAPILQLKFNDERGIDCPDDADDKKMDLHKHRSMPSPIHPSQLGIEYPERAYYQRRDSNQAVYLL